MADALLVSPSYPFVSLGATFTGFLQITQPQKKHLWVTHQAQILERVWEDGKGKDSKANCQTENQLLSCCLGDHRSWCPLDHHSPFYSQLGSDTMHAQGSDVESPLHFPSVAWEMAEQAKHTLPSKA